MAELRAASGQEIDVQRNAGPGSYNNGDGLSITSNLGRVDEFTVEGDVGSLETRRDSITSEGTGGTGENVMVITVFSQDSAGPSEIVEVADGDDLSSLNITTVAYRL